MTGPVAIFPWGEVIEVFLDPLGLTAEAFAIRMKGGWLFGYVAALARRGRGAVIVYASERVAAPRRLVHAETGAPIWLVPGRRTGQGRARALPALQAIQQWRGTPWRAFDRVLAAEGCSAMLVQDYEHARFDALALLARRRGLPLFATFQGGDVTASPLERRVRRLTLRQCERLIVPSARERERLAQSYGLTPERMCDIPNPVDVEAWRAEPAAAARTRLGVERDAFLVVWHGRIDIHRKGLDVLLEAWRQVRSRRPDARLVLLGSGQDHDVFAAHLAGAEAVDWRAAYTTDPTQVRRWLSAADVYVTLSRTEGMPVAPLEAMACARPVVASDAHGL
ncbi:glycosyltransferase family 4 protein, partial [Phenylobacterium sp.]|uniref:glycosyltransferase family 4 protein n=1 Tax=Phenylobacterium sp. TaxID=1871053 RepID=UPI002812487F